MALISEWMEQCGKKVLDNAGIVRDAMLQQPSVIIPLPVEHGLYTAHSQDLTSGRPRRFWVYLDYES